MYLYDLSYLDILLTFLKCKYVDTVDNLVRGYRREATLRKEMKQLLAETNADINSYPRPDLSSLYAQIRQTIDVT